VLEHSVVNWAESGSEKGGSENGSYENSKAAEIIGTERISGISDESLTERQEGLSTDEPEDVFERRLENETGDDSELEDYANLKSEVYPRDASDQSESFAGREGLRSSAELRLALAKALDQHTYVNTTTSYTATAATQTSPKEEAPPRPCFSPAWQTQQEFGPSGGVLSRAHSDVKLEVPCGAVPLAHFVNVRSAVSVDLEALHSIVQLTNDEYVVSPIAEFHAGNKDVAFLSPVRITLPTFLPQGFCRDKVNVYRFTTDQFGRMTSLERLMPPTKTENVSHDSNLEERQSSPEQIRGTGQERVTEDQSRISPGEEQLSSEGEGILHSGDSSSTTDQDPPLLEERSPPNGVPTLGERRLSDQDKLSTENAVVKLPDQRVASYSIAANNKIIVRTTGFSGYICTYCGRMCTPPVVHMDLLARHEDRASVRPGRQVKVRLVLWDGRYEVADFRAVSLFTIAHNRFLRLNSLRCCIAAIVVP
jgi:hypothetical protein